MRINKKVCEDTVFQVNLTEEEAEEEAEKSSSYRELRGIKEGMKAVVDKISWELG